LAVAALSAHNVWAVGDNGDSYDPIVIVEHYNGKRWRVVNSPNVPSGHGELNNVAVIPAHNVWAVGDNQSNFISAHRYHKRA
jgi:hypothetical protein